VIIPGKNGIYLDLHVQPNARQSGVRGVHGDALKIAVAESPQSGRANKATVAAIAGLFRVSVSAVSLVGGRTSRRKRVHVEDLDPSRARRIVEAALEKRSD
jgi:uncharacterized protein (TIGR00251 family)